METADLSYFSPKPRCRRRDLADGLLTRDPRAARKMAAE